MSIVDRHQSPVTWQTHNRHPALHQLLQSSSPAPPGSGAGTPSIAAVTAGSQPSRHYYGSSYGSGARPPSTSVYDAPVPAKNERELTRETLREILDYFSQLVPRHFGPNRPIRLVVHGGACMLLHEGIYKLSVQQQQMSPHLPRRTTTRDVDYIHRSFVTEMTSMGVPDAASRLAECVKAIARRFGLGLDWMNSDADIALPYAYDPQGKPYDPIYHASIQANNIDLHTIYTSPNKLLTLISVTPFWAVSLKLVRYVKWDPGDICLLLR
ncbi:hypothetical protein CPB83DRAFT_762493 [Crepidotus variabilis]|uniref:Uncharacterized protein n=1 Tax=Crepidotus variabilis TaxID=179855 RepID=A0A9P6JSQ7_9AGAR|nr:hypothetical protein CPB83DRAFT_762493 [Crepidotus variabilis]